MERETRWGGRCTEEEREKRKISRCRERVRRSCIIGRKREREREQNGGRGKSDERERDILQ